MTSFALSEEMREAKARQAAFRQQVAPGQALQQQQAAGQQMALSPMSDEQLVERFQAAASQLSNLLLSLPNSRRHETEADLVRDSDHVCT